MARKKPAASEFIAFDVIYEDGSQTSNRRVATTDIDPILAITLANESFHYLPDVIPEAVDPDA